MDESDHVVFVFEGVAYLVPHCWFARNHTRAEWMHIVAGCERVDDNGDGDRENSGSDSRARRRDT